MEMIWESIKHAYAYLAVIPIIPFTIILFGYGAYIQDRKKRSDWQWMLRQPY